MDTNRELDGLLERMVTEYVARNRAAKILKGLLEEAGVGFYPVVDHVTLRTLDIDRRAQPFVTLGYAYDETLQYDDWYAKVYRKTGYPALFVDQAYADDRGKSSIIPVWVTCVRRPGVSPCRGAGGRYRESRRPVEEKRSRIRRQHRRRRRGTTATDFFIPRDGRRSTFHRTGTCGTTPRLSRISSAAGRQLDEIHCVAAIASLVSVRPFEGCRKAGPSIGRRI